MSKNPISKDVILKTVQTTQSIEGYKPADTDTKQRAKLLMEKYGIKVSVKK